MGRRKDLSVFSDLELVYELRARGLAATVYGPDDLEEVGVPESRRRKAFDRVRDRVEDHMSFAANEFLDSEFRGYLDKMLEKISKEDKQ